MASQHTPKPQADDCTPATCGCWCGVTDRRPVIHFCSTHAAAPEMLEMIHRAMQAEDPDEWTSDASALLARIEGKE